MEFYDKTTIYSIDISYPDVYFTPEYGLACEFSDNSIWELCKYKDLIYVYLKRPIICDNITYYDLLTPYGYSGYYYENPQTFKEFIPLFREKAQEKNYVTEVLRQNPYLNININGYDIITSKLIYAVKVNNFDNYFKNILSSKKRNMYNKALKNNFSFELISLEEGILQEKFISLYNENMQKVNASDYYYFNYNYFNSLEKIDNSYLALCKDKYNNIIGSLIIYSYNNNVHYHLSCNNNSSNCITDFLLINVIKELCMKKLFVLGGGLKENDSLSKFKKKLSNNEFKYIIYKNILNEDVYEKLKNKLCKSKESVHFPIYR